MTRALKTVRTVTTTTVQYTATPFGPSREPGPHLIDLRALVTACEGMDDGLLVRIDRGHTGGDGRHDVTFSVVDRQPLDSPEVTP